MLVLEFIYTYGKLCLFIELKSFSFSDSCFRIGYWKTYLAQKISWNFQYKFAQVSLYLSNIMRTTFILWYLFKAKAIKLLLFRIQKHACIKIYQIFITFTEKLFFLILFQKTVIGFWIFGNILCVTQIFLWHLFNFPLVRFQRCLNISPGFY